MSRTSGRRDALSRKAPGPQACPFLLVLNVWLVLPTIVGRATSVLRASVLAHLLNSSKTFSS